MRAAQRIFLCWLILISAFCFPHFCFSQQALGKHPADKVLPVFYQQNTNASTTAQGLSNSVVPLEAPPLGVRIGGELRTTWPSGGGDASITYSNTLYVAKSGSDVTGLKDRIDKPFLTLSAAQLAAARGANLSVSAGSYVGMLLTNRGENWFFEPGASVSNANATALFNSATNSYTVAGYGNFTNDNNSAVLTVSNAASVVNFSANSVRSTIESDLTKGVLEAKAGTLLADVNVIDGYFGNAILWTLGDAKISAKTIYAYYGIWAEGNAAANLHVTAETIHGVVNAITVSSVEPTYRSWITAKEISGDGGGPTIVAGGRMYVNAQKINGADIVVFSGQGTLWLNTLKMSASANHFFSIEGGTVVARVDDWEDLGISTAGISIGSGNIDLMGGRMVLTNAPGVAFAGGAARFSDMVFDTSAKTNVSPIEITGNGTLTLKNVTLIAGGTNYCISAGGSARTVYVEGSLSTTNPIDPLITLVPRNVIAGDGTYLTGIPTNAVNATFYEWILSLTSGGDSTAIHGNASGEITAITDKATPVAADHLLIEDSAASNAKKDATVGSLETALEGVMDLQDLQGAVTDGQVPNSITVDLATLATTATTANAGDSATGFFPSGTLEETLLPTGINATKIANGTVTSAEFQFIGGLTSDAQTQLDAKVSTAQFDGGTNHLASWLTRTQDTRALTLTSLLNLFQGSFRGSIDTNSFKLGDAFVTTKPGVSGDIGIAIGINNALVADGNNQFAFGAGNIFHAGTDGYSTLIGIDNHGVFGSGDYSLAFGVANWLMEANAMTIGGFLTNTEAFSVDIGWEDATKASWSASGFTFRNQVIGLAGFSGSGASLTALNDDQVNFDDADNVFTATAVGPALEELNDSINAGVPNGSGAKLHWSQLLGVPAGFADGTDDGAGGGIGSARVEGTTFGTDLTSLGVSNTATITWTGTSNSGVGTFTASVIANSIAGAQLNVDATAESEIEAVVDLPDLQGAVTDGQVPDGITITLAATATALATPRTIGNVSFDGTANIVPETVAVVDSTDATSSPLIVDSATGNNQPKTDAGLTYNASSGTLTATAFSGPLSGNASTATALATPRTIGNVSFDGTANIVPETIAVVDSTDATSSPLIVDSATGNNQPKTDAGLTYNASSGTLTATAFSGPLSGNASTATALATPRTIGNVSFDGTANIVPETVAVVDSTDATSSPLMVDSATGNNQPKTDAGLTYNASSGTLAATEFSGGGASLTAINDDQVAFDDADGVFTATAVGPALEELNDSINGGVPNGSGAKTHWSQLLGVPAGFADGTDDGAGGSPFPLTVTTVLITNFASGEQAIVATKDWNSTTNLALDFYFAASRNTLYRDAFGMYFDNFGGASFTFKQGLKVVNLAGTGNRLVQADADGEVSATLDASTLASETGENTFISKVRIEGSNDISGRLIITIVTNSQVWNFLMAGSQIITNDNFIFTSSGVMALGQHYSLTVSNSHPSTGLTWTSPTNDLFWPATNAYAGNAFVPAASEVIYDLWFDGAKMNAKVESGPDNTNLVRVAMSFRPVITSGAAGNVLADNGVPDGNTRIYTNGPPSAVGGTVQTNILASFSNGLNSATMNVSNVFQVKTTNDTLALEINTNGLAYFSTGVNVQGTTAGSLQLREPSATGSDYTGWKAPASVTTSYQFVPPAAVASAGLLRAAATASSESAVTVVKLKSYIQLTGFDNATGAIPVNSNDWAAVTYMRPQFLNGTDQASNFIEWRLIVPEDIETTTELRAKLKFRLTGADTATHRYVLSMVSVADSAAFTGTPGTAINLDFAGDASGASGDVESVGYTTLTGWGAAVTAGQHWVIRLARDGDTSDASTVDSMFGSLVIEYGVAP